MTGRALVFDELRLGHDETTTRTRWTVGLSLGLHLALLLVLAAMPHAIHTQPVLTEITMVGPGDADPEAAPAGAAAAPHAAAAAVGARVASVRDDHFRRADVATFAPDPQSASATADRMTARLAALQQAAVEPIAGSAAGAPAALWSTPAGVANGLGSGGSAISLHRGSGDGSGPPLSLGRGPGGTGAGATLARAATPAPDASAEAPARESDTAARRTLAGASLAGPIADRAVLQATTPAYPEWAKRDGVEGSVSIYFVVRADGTVKENVLVQKTAGFAEFDDNARAAILAWRFAPLHDGRTGEQWGTITFHYHLRGA